MPASYKVPQNVDLEDKILGPFTLKQFFYLLAAGLATFISFNIFYRLAPPLFVISALVIWGITGAFVFVRPNDQPFTKFFFSFLWFSLKPNRRVWHRLPSLGEIALSDTPEEKAPPQPAEPSPDEMKSHLQRLAHVVDTRGWSDVDEEEADISARVTSGEAKPKLNVYMTDSDQPEDILAAEDEQRGSDRATAELERVLKTGVAKPRVKGAKRAPAEG